MGSVIHKKLLWDHPMTLSTMGFVHPENLKSYMSANKETLVRLCMQS